MFTCTCMYIYKYSYIFTYIYVYINTYTRTNIHTDIHTHKHNPQRAIKYSHSPFLWQGVGDVVPKMKERGWIIAAGLHPDCAGEYFRFGHMGYSVTKKPEYLQALLKDLDAVCKA